MLVKIICVVMRLLLKQNKTCKKISHIHHCSGPSPNKKRHSQAQACKICKNIIGHRLCSNLGKSGLVKKLKTKKSGSTNWTTKACTFTTTRKVKLNFILPEFHPNREINWEMYGDESKPKKSSYDMIIGRDLLFELGINFLFDQQIMTWDGASVAMKPPDYLRQRTAKVFENEIQLMEDPDTTDIERIQRTLDVKYAPADLEAEVNKSEDLTVEQRNQLLELLLTYEDLFDGKL